ncbi:MAG: cardiolipin synthase B [Candidatus Rokuibacteriota bacterium]|nr:MAG: cardiolipin synthase B [Candidatus Rokubacteria bacterium]
MRHRIRRFTVVAIVCLAVGAGCARVQPHVSLPALRLGEPSFFPTLEAYAGAPIVGGNTVEILLNGEHIFPAVLAGIRSAQRTITYAQYYYADGPVARDIAEALAERCRAGVGVNVLLDAFGSLSIPGEYLAIMRASGCHVVWFRPLSQYVFRRYYHRNHRRILVVDGRVGFTGGAGVSRKWMGNGRTEDHWRDTDVRVEGPVVEYMQAAFVEQWLEATGMVLGGEAYFPRPIESRGQVHAQVARSSPASGSAAMYTTLLLALSSARTSVLVTNPYFVLDHRMQDAVLRTVRRGVRVAVLVPAVIDHNIVRQASRAQFGELLQAGVEIYEYAPALLHAKTIAIDGVWATIGSTNLDNLSFAVNDELNLFFYDRDVAQQLERIFMDDVQVSRRITYEAWKNRGVGARLLEMLALPIRDLL